MWPANDPRKGLMGGSNSPVISVVLATRNRAENLARLLRGLAAQVGSPDFEVVVADNGSEDGTPAVIEAIRPELVLQTVRVPRPGKGRALNAALVLARGEIVVFTDDDVIPAPDWLAEISRAASAFPAHNVFGGRIEVDAKAVPGWIRRSFNLMGLLTSAHDRGDAPATYGHGEYPFGPNMAVRRALLAHLDAPYPEEMGPGTRHPVGDETSFFLRISSPERKDRLFVPSARVLHEVEPENVAFGTALKRCYQAGIAHGRLGLSAVASGAEPNHGQPSTMRLISRRIKSARSLRELACIMSRYLGYRQGRQIGPFLEVVQAQ
jgi:glucosyl-dolichyl phosphate glucuronosyltransferase